MTVPSRPASPVGSTGPKIHCQLKLTWHDTLPTVHARSPQLATNLRQVLADPAFCWLAFCQRGCISCRLPRCAMMRPACLVCRRASARPHEVPDEYPRIPIRSYKHVHHKECFLQKPTWNVSFGNICAPTIAYCLIAEEMHFFCNTPKRGNAQLATAASAVDGEMHLKVTLIISTDGMSWPATQKVVVGFSKT